MPDLQFLGACATVTGSKFLLSWKNFKLLVDCGLFQGGRELKSRNWEAFPVAPSSIDRVALTHAHIDHTGFLPRFVSMGFSGPVSVTRSTAALLHLLLPDSARLQVEDAGYANKTGYSRHKPALPLYDENQAHAALRLMERQEFGVAREIHPGVQMTFLPAGHILGSGFVELKFKSADGQPRRALFTGDLGRPGAPILCDPELVEAADYLILESTYGGRTHDRTDPRQQLAEVIGETVKRGGVVVIPAFAIGRVQEIIYFLNQLFEQKQLPEIPVYVDSPMAVETVRLYENAHSEHDDEMKRMMAEERDALFRGPVHAVRTARESKDLNARRGPMVIVSASGMASGGRVVHHLKHRLPREENSVVFVGYQAAGTRGRKLIEGAKVVEIHGEAIPVRARVKSLTTFSAHADEPETLGWLGHFKTPPRVTYLVHGEDDAREALAASIRAKLGWTVELPKLGDTVKL